MNKELRNQNQKSRFSTREPDERSGRRMTATHELGEWSSRRMTVKILMGVFLATVFVFSGLFYSSFAYAQYFPSASDSTQTGALVVSGFDTCPDGQYMSGLNRRTLGGSDNETQIMCSPAPSGYSFPSTSNSTMTGAMTVSGFDTCPDGQYVSGLNRNTPGGSDDYTQILCSPAPALPADFGENCNIAPFNRPCGFGFVCNSSNICDIPTRSSCDLNSSGPEWTANYKPDSGGAAYAYATAVDAAGNIYVTGEAFNAVSANSGLDMFVSKYNSSGSRLWTEYYDDNGNEAGYGVAVIADGSAVYVVGRKDAQNAGDDMSFADMFIRKYDANGGLLWTQTSGRAGADLARSVAVDAAGNIYVAGYEQHSGRSDIDAVIWQFNSSGNFLNTVSYDIGGNESAYGIALDQSNNIYITGYQSTQSGDMVLIKYNSVGTQQWTRSYDSLLSDPVFSSTAITESVCLDHSVGLIYETNETVARVYMADAPDSFGGWFSNCGDDPGYWNTSTGKTLFFEFDWNNIPPEISSLTTTIGGTCNSACSGATTFTRTTVNDTRFDPDSDCCGNSGNITATLPLTVSWNIIPRTEIGRGVSVSDDGTVFVTGYQSSGGGDMFLNAYQATDGAPKWDKAEIYNSGDQNNDVGRAVAAGRAGVGRVYVAGSQGTNNDDVFLQEYFSSDYNVFLQNTLISDLPYQDIAYGIDIGPASENEPVYVSGYRASNGGEAFLSKYSCNAPTGAGATSNGYFTVSPANIYTDMEVRVDATQSGPGISEYEWNWDYINNPSDFISGGVKDEHIYNTTGLYTIALRITYIDLTLQPAIITQPIIVYANHQPTAAAFTVTPSTGAAPLVVTVNGAGSDPDGPDPNYDPGDYIKNFIWDWGDGTPKGQGQQTTHLYSRPTSTSYTITLIVEDSIGASNSFSLPVTQTVTVTEQYVCSGGCGADEPICGPTNDGSATQCYQCLSDTDCGSGYQCLGTPCKSGQMCSDGTTECPADGRCPEATFCKSGDACPDGTACPADGICYSQGNKNTCVLSSDTQAARCYTEGVLAGCATDLDCTASLQGGTCDAVSGECRYARCLNETSFTCESDKDCNNSDGICLDGTGLCDYIYDCAYGPGMNDGATTTAAVLAPAMPAMPIGIQPDGEACTKPTPDAPNNCEGLNGCLYYNYNGDGTPVAGDANNPIGSSVANCVNKFEGGTGCIYYGDQSDVVYSRASCLPGTDFSKLKSKTAPDGIPAGCVAIDKGSGKKEYDCTGVNNCYYYLNGTVDCDYMGGTGCIYEPNPAGAAFCPRAFKTPTGGINYVQCLLNPDATLPSFLLGSSASGLSTCSTGADCPASAPVCINGTCYPACQGDVDCVTGGVCLDECDTDFDCDGNLICNGVCQCPSGTTLNLISGLCELTTDPNSFRCLDTTTDHQLDYGTRSADIAVRSSQNASCRWSLFDVPFAGMENSFGSGDSINHTATADGLPDAGPATIFVECDNGTGATASCNAPLTLSDPCDSDADCYGLICNNGWCRAPVCANAQPQGSLPYSALSDGTPISMTTTVDSNCVYSNTYDNANQCVAPILSCSTAAPFDPPNGDTEHSAFLPGSSLAVGNNYQYAKCQETAPPQSLSTTCTIPVRVLTCNPYAVTNECDDDWTCVGVGSGPGVCEPPICAGATPTATTTLPYATIATGTDIGMTTDAAANCRYSENYTDPYGSMVNFTSTGGTAHSTNIPVLAGGNRRYVKCLGTASGEESSVCTVRFNVEGAPCDPDSYQCSNGLECRNGRCAIPICSGAYPRGRQEAGAFVPIGMNTGVVASECRFADTLVPYDSMVNVFLTLDRLVHGRDGTTQNTVQVQEGNNTKYVACRADAAPNNTDTCTIQFTGGSCRTSFDCALGMVCNSSTGDCEDCSTNPDLLECAPPPPPPPPPICPPFCPPPPPPPPGGSCNTLGYEFFNHAIRPSGNCSLVAIILALLSWLAWIVALLAVLSGLRAAYLYITSAGDEKKLRLAYQYLIYTTIGVGVAIVSFSAVAITRAILNI